MRYYGLSDLGDFGDLPVSLDAGLAPVVGGGAAMGVAALAKRYGKEGGFVSRRAGIVGAAAGAGASVLYGFARGWGSALAGGVTALVVGFGYEAINAAYAARVKAAISTPPTNAPVTEGGGGGLGFIRAKQLAGYGQARGYLPAIGSSPLDVLRSHAGVTF